MLNPLASRGRLRRALAALVAAALGGLPAAAQQPASPPVRSSVPAQPPASPQPRPPPGCPVSPAPVNPFGAFEAGTAAAGATATGTAAAGATAAGAAAGTAAAATPVTSPLVCRPPTYNVRPACMARRPLCPSDLEVAKIAWKYFENNYHKRTGLVNSVDDYPSSTIWDIASSLAATVSAYELGLIKEKELDDRLTGMLGSLNSFKLFEDTAPNKAYSAATGEMTDYNNNPTKGIGFSALDIARLASWLNVVACMYPKYLDTTQQLLQRWNYCPIIQNGQMYGAYVDQATKKTKHVQEGRLGYEQYAGKAFALLGFDQHFSADYDNGTGMTEDIYGVPIRYDVRDPKKLGAYNYVVTESYALDGMEFGRDEQNRTLITNIFEVQKRRWQRTGKVTAASEDNVDREPWFVYNTIFVAGGPWKAITDHGYDESALASVSTKAAFSLAALFPDDPYSEVLMSKVANAYDPAKGWYSGIYEKGIGYNKSITANTNGIILETLLYKVYGPLQMMCQRCNRGVHLDPELVRSKDGQAHCLPGAAPLEAAADASH